MTRRSAVKLVPLVLVILIVALGMSPADALAAQSANFEATLRGSQLETTSLPADPYCDAPAINTKENLDFHTPAPVRVEITYLGSPIVFLNSADALTFYTTGSVARQKNAFTCRPDDPDDPHRPLGCGTRQFSRWRFTLEAAGPDPLRNLEASSIAPGEFRDPFDNCTPFGVHFPDLLVLDRPILARVSKTQILDPDQRTIVLSAHGTVSYPGVRGGTTRNSLSWTLTLHRVGDQQVRAVELALKPATVLQHVDLGVRLFPPGATAQSYEWEMRRSRSSGWTTLGMTTKPAFRFTAEAAGHFKLRTVLNGVRPTPVSAPRRVVTPQIGLEVMFPTRGQIVADQRVDNFTLYAWGQTLALATPQSRREVGFWIALDTCSGRYRQTTTTLGPPVGPREDAEVFLGPRPADIPSNPPGVKGCATYTVASFHTHTPTTYREPLDERRPVGPSAQDKQNAKQRMLPGFVYDYIADPLESGEIPVGHPKHSPAQLYRYGDLRRPTP